HHGVERSLGVARHELLAQVLLPEIVEALLGGGERSVRARLGHVVSSLLGLVRGACRAPPGAGRGGCRRGRRGSCWAFPSSAPASSRRVSPRRPRSESTASTRCSSDAIPWRGPGVAPGDS